MSNESSSHFGDVELLAGAYAQASPAAEMTSVQDFQLLGTSDGETASGGYWQPIISRCSLRIRLWMIRVSSLAFTLLVGGALVLFLDRLFHRSGHLTGQMPGLTCEECAVVYYAGVACLLAGRPLGDSAYEKVGLYNALMPGNHTLRELFALFDKQEFQEGARCPEWMRWDEQRHRCDVPQGALALDCPHGVGFLDSEGSVCTANLYSRQRAAAWGGRCTCPDGAEYFVSDRDDVCGSLACDGGDVSGCSKDGIPRRFEGFGATCFPDINASAMQLKRAHPLADESCWHGRLPLFVLPGFQADCKPESTINRAGRTMHGFMDYAIGVSKCAYCLNWYPTHFK
eukprot:TRINITY_DN49308_c0_g2_i2.p1 TRINITY_DN49308_c0_g2~~TRINITY_DN49308_c0_g2_i2.p1  ORF type:complete len:342 (-),score=17.59 TRINITY_DN49308_c0_g2_i2:78-1103(-)